MSWLERPWGALHYQERRGSGPPLVLLHGTGCDNADWEAVIAALPPGQALAAPEFRGHGRSGAPSTPFALEDLADDTLSLIERLAYERCILVGHSLGGMVAMAAAGRSSRVCGLVLLEGWTRLAVVRAAFDETHLYGPLRESEVQRIRLKSDSTKARFTPHAWDAFWGTVEAFDARRYLARAEIPIVQVYGTYGRRADARQRLEVPERSNITWLWLEGPGHYLPHERPAEVARICATACAP